MVNFRYHLVSLTAVFLALALGIAVGAGAVRQGTVDVLNKRLDSVERSVKKTNAENDKLRSDLAVWGRFADQAGNQLIAGRLRNVPVLAVGVRGIDTKSVDSLRQAVIDAGATFQGTIWFTAKMKLAKPDEATELATLLGSTLTRPDLLRQAALARLAAAWSAQGTGDPVTALVQAGFLEIDNPPSGTLDPTLVPTPGSLFVVASGAGASVTNDILAVPFVRELAQRLPIRVEAVEATAPASTASRPTPPAFVAALRAAGGDLKLSTVDDIDTFEGRVAAVLALDNLPNGKTGHYGLTSGADGLVPTASR
jgi:hypothetical protein